MARMTFRDRFFTPPVARAVVSPSGILLAGAGVAVGIVVGLPVVAIAAVGGLAWASRVAFSIPRNPTKEHIDPFALQDPWRTFVRQAQQANTRFDGAVARARRGPLRERLNEIGDRLDTGVSESWRIARAGQALADARSQIDVRDVSYQLSQLNGPPGTPAPPPGSATAQTIQAFESQIATVTRMDRLIAETSARLRLLDARISESVVRAIELSVRAEGAEELGGLSADVDSLVSELESLRLALDETEPQDVVLPTLSAPEAEAEVQAVVEAEVENHGQGDDPGTPTPHPG